MCRAALASRFSTIRSTLGASTAISTGAVSKLMGMLAEQIRSCVLDDLADQLTKIDTLTVGVEGAALGEAFQIQQVGQQAAELAGVARQPAEQVANLAGRQQLVASV